MEHALPCPSIPRVDEFVATNPYTSMGDGAPGLESYNIAKHWDWDSHSISKQSFQISFFIPVEMPIRRVVDEFRQQFLQIRLREYPHGRIHPNEEEETIYS
jgi:hypothetical protein